jgi:zinc protease
MFEGSETSTGGYFPPLQQAGALLNGSTTSDRTNYWEVVPTSAVELALWMESDQDGLSPSGGDAQTDSRRSATSVLNERARTTRTVRTAWP